MPTDFLNADTSFPNLNGMKSTDEKFAAITNYLYMLLEQLRYVLRNLTPENFNEQALNAWVDGLDIKAGNIDARTIISQTVITNELYTKYGQIADLTVDKLRTDYKKAQRYLGGDTGTLDYIYIHDEEINFITATTDGSQAEQMNVDGRLFYWTDETQTQMTSEDVTAWPVMVYVYNELVKARIMFEPLTLEDGTHTKMPVLIWGAGDGKGGGSDQTRMYKTQKQGLVLQYQTGAGKEIGMVMTSDGYVDITGLRKTTALDFSQWDTGGFTETVDGDITQQYGVAFDDQGRPIRITDGDGHETTVNWGDET